MTNRTENVARAISVRLGRGIAYPLDLLEACGITAPGWFQERGIPVPNRITGWTGYVAPHTQAEVSPETAAIMAVANLVSQARGKPHTTISDVVFALRVEAPADVIAFWDGVGYDPVPLYLKLRDEEPLTRLDDTARAALKDIQKAIIAVMPFVTQGDVGDCVQSVRGLLAHVVQTYNQEYVVERVTRYTVEAANPDEAIQIVIRGGKLEGGPVRWRADQVPKKRTSHANSGNY